MMYPGLGLNWCNLYVRDGTSCQNPVPPRGKISSLSRCPFVPGQWRNFCPVVLKSCTVPSHWKPYFIHDLFSYKKIPGLKLFCPGMSSCLVKVAFIQKVQFVFHISKSPIKIIPNYYPELEIWICCLLFLAGNFNFKLRVAFWNFFLEIWSSKKWGYWLWL